MSVVFPNLYFPPFFLMMVDLISSINHRKFKQYLKGLFIHGDSIYQRRFGSVLFAILDLHKLTSLSKSYSLYHFGFFFL